MTTQTLTIGKRRFVLITERDFQRLTKQAAAIAVRSEFAEDAMHDLKAYRKTRKANSWTSVKRKMGL